MVFFFLNVRMSYKSRKCMVIDGVPIGGMQFLGYNKDVIHSEQRST